MLRSSLAIWSRCSSPRTPAPYISHTAVITSRIPIPGVSSWHRADGQEFPVHGAWNTLAVEDGFLVVASLRRHTPRSAHAAADRTAGGGGSSSTRRSSAETLEGVITDWNPAAERLYGYLAREVIGKPISVLLSHASQQAELREILDRVGDGEGVETY